MYVRFTPKADELHTVPLGPLCAISGCEQSQQGNPLLDHLVGASEQGWGDVEAEHARCRIRPSTASGAGPTRKPSNLAPMRRMG
jgi:hypothetical protein